VQAGCAFLSGRERGKTLENETKQKVLDSMIKCFNCGGNADVPGAIVISIDGDFVCSKRCKAEYERKRDHFLNAVIHDDAKMDAWWKGEDYA